MAVSTEVPRANFSPLREGDGLVRVMVKLYAPMAAFDFSPLREGDGLVSLRTSIGISDGLEISVPFAKGTAL